VRTTKCVACVHTDSLRLGTTHAMTQDFSQVHVVWLSLLRLLDDALVDTNETTTYGLDMVGVGCVTCGVSRWA